MQFRVTIIPSGPNHNAQALHKKSLHKQPQTQSQAIFILSGLNHAAQAFWVCSHFMKIWRQISFISDWSMGLWCDSLPNRGTILQLGSYNGAPCDLSPFDWGSCMIETAGIHAPPLSVAVSLSNKWHHWKSMGFLQKLGMCKCYNRPNTSEWNK